MQNHKFRTLTGQIMQFAISHYHKQEITKEQLELVKKLCLQDNQYLHNAFKDHQGDDAFLLQTMQQLSERDLQEDRKTQVEVDDKKVKLAFKSEIATFISWLDDILTLKVFYLVQRMFELGHLTCLRIDLVNKEVVPISAKDENVNVQYKKLDFSQLVHQLQNKRHNVIESACDVVIASFAKIANPEFLQQLVFRYTNVQALLVMDHGLKDFDTFITFMRDIVEIALRPRSLGIEQKTVVLENARLFLTHLCNKESESYSNSRLQTTSPDVKHKLKITHLKFHSKMMVASERIHFYKQQVPHNYFDFDSRGKLRFANLTQQLPNLVHQGVAYQTHYQKVFSDDNLIMHMELSKSHTKLPEENRSGAIVLAKRFEGKFRGLTVILERQAVQPTSSSQPEGAKMNTLSMFTKFKKAVTKVKFLNKSSRAFISKQLLQHNPTYRRTFMIEFLSDKEIQGMEMQGEQQTQNPISTKPTVVPGIAQKSGEKKTKYPINFQELKEFSRLTFTVNTEITSRLGDPDMDIFEYDENIKLMAVVQMFLVHNIPSVYKIDIEDLRTFLFLLRHHYNKRRNPFHNFDHAITVMHGCFYLSNEEPAKQILSQIHVYGLLLAGLCHDVDHRATTNLFLINCGDKLSHRYFDKSVLENHHAATTFKLLSNTNADIFKNLDGGMKQQLRKFIVNNILATDVREHFNQLGSFESKLNQYEDGYQQFSSEEQILHLMGLLTHASDFFGSTKPYKVSRVWSTKVNAEFIKQYETEVRLGLPQTSYFKDVDKIQNQGKGELGFLRVIVKPLWELLNKFYAGKLTPILRNMEDAMEIWEQIVKDYQKEQEEMQQSQQD